jgi:hypothetical protein
VKPTAFSPDIFGEQVVPFTERVKVAPAPDEFELYRKDAFPEAGVVIVGYDDNARLSRGGACGRGLRLRLQR